MAPLNQVKGGPGNSFEYKRGFSGRALCGGRAVRGGRQRRGKKSSFISSRVDEQAGDEAEDSEEPSKLEPEAGLISDSLSSGEEDIEAAAVTVKAYSVLLQSLNDTTQRGQPPPKKQKKKRVELSENVELGDKDLDLVVEPEDTDDLGIDDMIDDDGDGDDEANEGHDPFIMHLASRDESELAQMIEDVKNNKWLLTKTIEAAKWSSPVKVPASSKASSLPGSKGLQSTKRISLKQKLKTPAARLLPAFSQLTGSLASYVFGYHDILFPDRSLKLAEDLRKLACLHSLNHVFKTRDKVIKNSARIAGKNLDESIEYRDQGFTRPKVLIILPTRQSCAKYVDTIISLAEPEQQENKKRFQDSYIQDEDNFSEDKSEDFRELFGGNDDDMFRLGLKFTRKTVKFFSQFYNSDIILASPLGLRMALGEEKSKEQDHDFLSSIEIFILDQCDALAMQNWEHVEYIFGHLNLQPMEAHGCDFSRVRGWYLENNAKYLRQTILFSSFNFPSLNRLYTRHMLNVSGKVKYHKIYDGAMLELGIQVKQTFSRYNSISPVADPDDRFNYFTTAVVPSLTKLSKIGNGGNLGILIYLPLYTDFVRVRNYLATSSSAQNISFGSISEYTAIKDVARARSHFVSGRHSILLYTERAHHFRRYHLKGAKSIIMYGLPENPLFYKEVVGGYLASSFVEDPSLVRVRSLFSRLDILKLERIVGTKRYMLMANEKSCDTFDFI